MPLESPLASVELQTALEPCVFELSTPGHRGLALPTANTTSNIPTNLQDLLPGVTLRSTAPRLPELAQLDVVRHFIRLSQLNHAIDKGFYPLGSCTMKYNPKIADRVSNLANFAQLHPEAPAHLAQGTLAVMGQLQAYIAGLTGFDAVTLQPAAGAQGELVGMLMIKAALAAKGQGHRKQVLIPDSAHGTNPASAQMCGFEVVEIKSGPDGRVPLEAVKAACGPNTAGLMLTNPNTLGLFETEIIDIAAVVHNAGGYMYYDGANFNALVGRVPPRLMGFDVMHINTHKTFATPHGGGGPGCGPVACVAELAPFLPYPLVQHLPNGTYALEQAPRPTSIGRVKGFNGNVDMMVRALVYLMTYGVEGLAQVSGDAVLNANYIKQSLSSAYDIPYEGVCKHEFVMTPAHQKVHYPDMTTMALVKRLMDFGIHPPTVYFPLIVHEAIMIEPTETESKATLDHFIAVMRNIADTCQNAPAVIMEAPHTTPVRKINETQANRQPNLNYWLNDGAAPAITR
jgi:glycine dehydrogenase subunit 2